MKRFLILLLCGLLLASVSVAYAAEEPSETQALVDSVLAACVEQAGADSVQDWIDGELAQGAGSRGEWYIIGLSQYKDEYDFSRYRAALEKYVADNEVRSATSRQRIALTFLAIGGGEDYIADVAENTIGELGIMSYVFGLHLLNNGVDCPGHTAETVIDEILSLRETDGGWAIRGDVAEIDTTAMVVQALAPYYDADEAVAAAIDKALDTLSGYQQPDGSYASYGVTNPESAVQILTALCALGLDPLEDGRFIKNECTLLDGVTMFRLEDGTFAHSDKNETNGTATMQSFYGLVALWRYEQGLGPFHIMDGPGADETVGERAPQRDYKFWVSIAAGALAVIGCLVLLLKGKKNYKNYLFVAAAALGVVCAVQFIDIQKPEDYYGGDMALGEDTITTTLSIRCDTVAGERDYIPADGVILDKVQIQLDRGATAADQLTAAARQYNLHMENEGGVSEYISGIAYIYEYDFGDLSGWMYRVNGVFADVGCGEYTLQDGDVVEWIYSREMGADLE